MSLLDKQPAVGHGFIYVLSNPQFKKNVFKVGLTTNSPAQRIAELSSTTGIPTKFHLEALYEVPEGKLRAIEKNAHLRLTELGHHVGKEFFECDRDICVQSVEDAILARWSDGPVDLLAQARERAALRKANWEKQEAELKAKEEALEKERKYIEKKRKSVDDLRDVYVSTEMGKVFWVQEQVPIFYISGFVCLAIWSGSGGIWPAVVFVAFVVFFKICVSSLRDELKKKSSLEYPYPEVGPIYEAKAPQRTRDTVEKGSSIKDLTKQNSNFTSTKLIRAKCESCATEFEVTLVRYENTARCPSCFNLNQFQIKW
jgi:hypothetical protein